MRGRKFGRVKRFGLLNGQRGKADLINVSTVFPAGRPFSLASINFGPLRNSWSVTGC